MNTKAFTNVPGINGYAPFALGFDDVFDRMTKYATREYSTTGFPPYNIRRIENRYYIDLAVAGLNRDDLSVVLDERVLTVSSTWDDKLEPYEGEYLHRSLSFSKFARKFDLADNMKVIGSTLEFGVLTIELEKIVPDQMSTTKIEIK